VEKPMHKEDISFIINAGVYLMNTEILPDVVENLKIEDNFFPDFVKTNRAKAYFHN
jgi:NDP-sugar pyrophosphorylase family protein